MYIASQHSLSVNLLCKVQRVRKKKLLSLLVWQLNSPSEYTNIVFLPTPLQYVYVNCDCQPFTLLSDNHNYKQ